MYTLDVKTQNALYKTHKFRIEGSEILEIGIPKFVDLDSPTGTTNQTLRDMCFDLHDINGQNVLVDVGNATRSGETVFH